MTSKFEIKYFLDTTRRFEPGYDPFFTYLDILLFFKDRKLMQLFINANHLDKPNMMKFMFIQQKESEKQTRHAFVHK